MKPDRQIALCLLLMLVLGSPGCVRIDIGDQLVAPTLGKQLIELDAAFQRGALDLVEFTRARDSLLGK
jgi:hypothetical protein